MKDKLGERIRIQITLSRLLGLIVVVSILMAWYADRKRLTADFESELARKNESIDVMFERLEAIESFSSVFGFGGMMKNGDDYVVGIMFDPRHVTDGDLEETARLEHLKVISLAYCHGISDKGIEFVVASPTLEVIYLCENNPTEPNGFTTAEELRFQPKLTDQTMVHLAGSSSLREVHLDGNEFTDEAIARLLELKTLERLVIYHRSLTPDVRNQFENRLPNLTIADGVNYPY